ncbi:MAG: 50S ribosomal protein L9 [Alphaproteobacteria bacterium]|nr:50S ribosomal protein L9 [Alphaproteobacteria bacterium]MBN2779914.1 50S ribosomal protein L9 [Alphaproteobacteria bacterium]
MEIILMENIGKLGKVGDVVTVRPGYARNYLFPMQKALRASEANKTIFESKRSEIEKKNADSQQNADSLSKKLNGVDFILTRQAGETGRLYGSVSARDIAEHINKKFGSTVDAHAVRLRTPLKEIGIFPLALVPYGDVMINFRIIVAQSEDEAKSLLEAEKDESEKAKKREADDAKKTLEAEKKADAEAPEEEAEEAAPAMEESSEKDS